MAFEPFGLVGGLTVGIPPVQVIDSNGNITANRANIANISTSRITSTGNITAPFFIGNIIGNVTANFVVPGTNTSVLFNQQGNAGASDNLQFNYSTNVLSLTGNLTVTNILTDNYRYANGAPYVFSAQASGTNTQIQFNSNGLLDASANLTFNSNTQTFSTNNISATSGVIANIQTTNLTSSGNVTATSFIGNLVGNVSNANTISANFFNGTLTTRAQPNVTSVGTLSGLTVAGNIIPAASNLYNLGSNVARWNDLYLSGNTIYLGNARLEANGTSLIFTNPDGSNYVFGGNDLTSTGNISAGGNLTIGNITAGNLISANYIAGTLTTATQPNITRVGILSNLSVAGNINGGNINAVNRVTANQFSGVLITGSQTNITSVGTLSSLRVTGDITSVSGVFTGNGSGLSQINAANIIGFIPNANYANTAGTALLATNAINANTANLANIANTAIVAGTVTTQAQPNITSVGTLSNLSVSGNVTATNFVGNFVGSIANANFASYAGNVTVSSQPNITSVGTLTALAVNGNITAPNIIANTGRFIGNGSGLSQLTAANVVGTVANATYATTAGFVATTGTVTTNSQPNITSVGILTSLSVNGNIASSNTISAINFNGTLTTNSQPNITSVGTLSLLNVSGNLTASNITATSVFAGNGSGLTNLSGANVVGAVANATYATSAGSTTTAGTVTTNSQPNINSVGTLTSLSVSGNITSGNIAGGNLVSANFVAGRLTTQAQPNITSVGTLSSLTVSGNVTATNITVTSGVFAGNGSRLTNLPGANVVGTVANATYATSAGSANTAVTVTGNNQPNINSVGVLTGLSSSGNITAPFFIGNIVGNISGNLVVPGTNTSVLFNQQGNAGASDALRFNYASNVLTANGNIVATYFIGNGGGLTNLSGANVVGAVANATYATSAGTSTRAVTVTGNSQPNINSVGVLTSLSVSGNITGANVAGGNLVSANFITGTLTTRAQPNITSTGTLSLLNVSGNLTAANITASGAFAGNGSRLTNLPGANVIGTVANATYAILAGSTTTAVTVTGNNQPNINSVGTLTRLSVSGNITGANVAGGNLVSANFVTGTLTTRAQPNITSVGILTGLSSTGNITAPYFFGNLIGNIDNANYAAYAGNVTNPLQPNITTVGTLSNLSISGTGNIIGGNLVSANFLTGTLTTNSQPNIRSVGNLSFLNVTTGLPGANGNITFNGSMSGTGSQSDISITGDVTASNIFATLIAGVLTTNDQPNITAIGNLTQLVVTENLSVIGNLSVNGRANLGNIANITIAGGNANYILSTNGAGNLSWKPEGTGVAAGSNTQVQFNDSGLLTGNASFTYNNATKIFNVAGNITSSNIISTNIIQSSRIISTVATGNSPFIVTSTTRVANLNVATSGVANTVNDAAQPNITSTGTLSSLSVSGNAIVGNLSTSGRIVALTATITGTANITTANITNATVGNANVTSNLQINTTGQLRVLGNLNATNSPNVFLGNVANVKITGGTNGQVLQTDGAGNLTWTAQTGGGGGNGVPGGANTQIQYNDAGTFGGSAFLTFNEATNVFQVNGNAIANSVQVGAGIYKFSTQYVRLATTTSTTSNQVIWSTASSNVSGVDFHVIATDATGATRQSVKISSVVYGTNIVWNEYGGLQINGITGSFSVDYNSGNVRLLVTPDSTNSTTYKMLITEYAP